MLKKKIIAMVLLLVVAFSTSAFGAETNMSLSATEHVTGESVPAEDLTLKVAEKELNGYTYCMKTYDKVKLTWESAEQAAAYGIYKYDPKSKKYKLYQKVDSGTTSVVVSGLNPEKTYYFKIRVYKDGDKGPLTGKLKVKMFDKTTGYFYEEVVWQEEWPGILITENPASPEEMAAYYVNTKDALECRTPIKYNYSIKDKSLYINVFAEFVGVPDEKFVIYNGDKEKVLKKSYHQLIKEAITEYWSVSVKGSDYDFVKGCNFKTKAVVYENTDYQNQFYVEVHVGTEKCLFKKDRFWFFTYFKNYTEAFRYTQFLSCPTQKQLRKNISKYYPPLDSVEDFKATIAHEMGHIFGLDDAYTGTTGVTRIRKNSETCWKDGKWYDNIMLGGEPGNKPISNDIEMILQAQGMAINGLANAYQSYVTCTIDGMKYVKSPVIRKIKAIRAA